METIISIMLFVFIFFMKVSFLTTLFKEDDEEKSKFNIMMITSGIGAAICAGLLIYNKYNSTFMNFVELIKESASDSTNLTVAIISGVLVLIMSGMILNKKTHRKSKF